MNGLRAMRKITPCGRRQASHAGKPLISTVSLKQRTSRNLDPLHARYSTVKLNKGEHDHGGRRFCMLLRLKTRLNLVCAGRSRLEGYCATPGRVEIRTEHVRQGGFHWLRTPDWTMSSASTVQGHLLVYRAKCIAERSDSGNNRSHTLFWAGRWEEVRSLRSTALVFKLRLLS